LPREVESIRRDRAVIAGCEALVHPLFTNGIVYLDLAFPLEGLSRDSLAWLPLASRFVTGAGLPGRGYDEVARALARSAGGFSAVLESGTPIGAASKDEGRARSFAILRLKALTERFPAALELALKLLSGADGGDLKRVDDIYAELRNDVVSALVPAGNAFAQTRAASRYGEASAIEDLWRGTSQVEFLLSLNKAEGGDYIADALRDLAPAVFSRRGLRINLTAEEGAIGGASAALESALGALRAECAASAPPKASYAPAAGPEAYPISAQVGFSAAACPAARIGDPAFGHETILAHYLGTGPLWEELRVKRGAYGASAWTDGLEGIACFSSYRDPRPLDSLAFFGEALAGAERIFAAGGPEAEALVEEAAIGCLGRERKPLLPEEKGYVDFKRSLYGITDDLRQAKRDAMLSARPIDLEGAACRLAASYLSSEAVLISRAEDVQSMRLAFPGTLARESPF
jgi:Zn-dependent M16 (insulinase) family peptidase